ncbi:MAG: dynamin family protein [Magnetococcales bacterium]|nr:dynamin family protein [Magnetococcales bacterium]
MFIRQNAQIERRIQSLEKHLKQENPVLLRVVQSFRDLDRVAYGMGLLNRDESFATRVSWWPLISILGTFSSGKSSFINSYLGQKLQRTGNQAVDDKFTVICYSKEEKVRTLPGIALDADPRFPFYQISEDVEDVASGEGRRIDAYLQLKTCPTPELQGRILIDSPGFDADAQRNSTLRITDHIMDLSDLVLVFFDARHPEPGAMKDTLDHLVANTIHRHDSNKFLFILNQIDCTAQDDNLEEVVAAWQRALSQSGLMAGRFYQIYNKDIAHPIPDEAIRARFEGKLEEEMAELKERIHRVEVDRAYRIIGTLENTAKMISDESVTKLTDLLARWRSGVLTMNSILFGSLAVIVGIVSVVNDISLMPPSMDEWMARDMLTQVINILSVLATLGAVGYVHHLVRKMVAWNISRKIPKEIDRPELQDAVSKGFAFNTGSMLNSIFRSGPKGWGMMSKNKIRKVQKDTDAFVQDLNDQFTNPSGKAGASNPQIPQVDAD